MGPWQSLDSGVPGILSLGLYSLAVFVVGRFTFKFCLVVLYRYLCTI